MKNKLLFFGVITLAVIIGFSLIACGGNGNGGGGNGGNECSECEEENCVCDDNKCPFCNEDEEDCICSGSGTPGLEFILNEDGLTYSVARGTLRYAIEIVIPAKHNGLLVTEIAESGFFYCTDLTNITIPNSITIIGDDAFRSCTSLTNITIPNSVTSIGVTAFRSSGLISIIILDGVISIGDYAFWTCSNLTSITIPVSIKNIDINILWDCNNMEYVFYGGSASDWNLINIASNNPILLNTTRYYYSETNPGTPNTHWRFVGGVPTIW
ncbi:MAG: leucine-rich repeat domain-containing protein [Treponema sp.]|nr:leucine-rich repeat domain-containing protein [Treponema sp.]